MMDIEQCSIYAVYQPCISWWTLSSAVSVLSSALYIMVDLEQCSLCAVYQPCISWWTLSSAVSVLFISLVYHGGPWSVQSLCCHQPCISWSTLSSAVSVLSSALHIMVDLEQCSLCAVISPVYHGGPWAVQSLCCLSALYIMVDLEQCSLCAVISPVYHGGPWAVQSLCCLSALYIMVDIEQCSLCAVYQPCISWWTLSSAVSVLSSALYIIVDLEQCSLCAVYQPCISWWTLSSAVSVLSSALYIMMYLEQCSLCAVYQPCISWWNLSSAVSVLSWALYIMVDLEQCSICAVISPVYHGRHWAVQTLCCLSALYIMVDLEQCSICAVISPVNHGGPWAVQSLCCLSALYIMVDLEQCSLCAAISPVYHGGPWAVQSLCCHQPCISWSTLSSAVSVLFISPVYHGRHWAVQYLCCHQPCISWWTLSSAESVLWSALYIMVDLEQCSLCAVISPVYHGGPWAVQYLCCHQPCISWWTLSSAVSVLSSAVYIMVGLEQCSLCAVVSPVYHGGPWAVQYLCCHQPCISWWTLSSAVSVLSSALYIMVDLEQCSLCAVVSPVYHGGPWAVQSLCCLSALYIMVDLEQCSLCAVYQPCISWWTLSSAVSVLFISPVYPGGPWAVQSMRRRQPCISWWTLSSAVSVLFIIPVYHGGRWAVQSLCCHQPCISWWTLSSAVSVLFISPVYHGGPWAVQSLCCHQPCISWSTLSSADSVLFISPVYHGRPWAVQLSVLSSALYIMVDLEQCSICAVYQPCISWWTLSSAVSVLFISPVYHGGPWAVQYLCCLSALYIMVDLEQCSICAVYQPCISWSTLSSAVSVLSSALYIMVDLEQCSICAVISPVYHGGPWTVQSLCCHQPCISWWTLSSAVSVLSSALYIMVDLEQCSLCAVISPVYHGVPWTVQSLGCHQPCISWWTLSSAVSVLSSALYIMVDPDLCSLCAVINPVYHGRHWAVQSLCCLSALYIMVDLEQRSISAVISPVYHGGPWAVQSLCCHQPCISWWTLNSAVSVLSSALYIMVDLEQCSLRAVISPVYHGGPWAVQYLCCHQPCISWWTLNSAVFVLSSALYIMVDLEQCSLCAVYQPCISWWNLSSAVSVLSWALYIMVDLDQCSICAVISPVYHGRHWAVQTLCCLSALYIMVDLEQCSICAVISPVNHGGPWAVQSLCCLSALYIMVDLEQCSLCAAISPVYHGGPWAVQSLCCHQPCISWSTLSSAVSVLFISPVYHGRHWAVQYLCCHQPCISWWTLSSAESVLWSALYIMVDLEQCSICAVISPVYLGGPWAVQSLCCHQPCISWWALNSAVSVLSSALYIMVDLEQCSICAVISPVYHGGPWAVQYLCCHQPCISWWTLNSAVSVLSSALYIMVDLEQCSLCAVYQLCISWWTLSSAVSVLFISLVYHGGPWAVQSLCCLSALYIMVDLEQCSLCAVVSPVYHGGPWAVQSLCCLSSLYIMVDVEQCSLCAVISPVYHGGPWAVQSLCCLSALYIMVDLEQCSLCAVYQPCISWWTLSSAVSVLSSALYIMVDIEQCRLCAVYQPCISWSTLSSAVVCAVISPVYHGGPWAVQYLCCLSALYIMVDLEQCSICAVYQPCISWWTLSSAVSVLFISPVYHGGPWAVQYLCCLSAVYIMVDIEQCSICAVISPVYHGGPWAVQYLCCDQPCISWWTLNSAVSVLSSALYIMVDLEQCSLCAVISPVYHGGPWAVQSLCCHQPCISWWTLNSAVSGLSSALYIMVDLEQCSLCAVISPVYHGGPWALQSLCCHQPCISWSTLSSAVSVLFISPVYHGRPWAAQYQCCHQPCISWWTLSSAVSVLSSALYIMVDLEQCSLCAVVSPVYHGGPWAVQSPCCHQPCISWWTLSSAVSVLSSALYIMVDLEQCSLCAVVSPVYHGGPWAVQSLCCHQPCISWWTLSSAVSVLSSALYIMVDLEQCSLCAVVSPVYHGRHWAVQSLCCLSALYIMVDLDQCSLCAAISPVYHGGPWAVQSLCCHQPCISWSTLSSAVSVLSSALYSVYHGGPWAVQSLCCDQPCISWWTLNSAVSVLSSALYIMVDLEQCSLCAVISPVYHGGPWAVQYLCCHQPCISWWTLSSAISVLSSALYIMVYIEQCSLCAVYQPYISWSTLSSVVYVLSSALYIMVDLEQCSLCAVISPVQCISWWALSSAVSVLRSALYIMVDLEQCSLCAVISPVYHGGPWAVQSLCCHQPCISWWTLSSAVSVLSSALYIMVDLEQCSICAVISPAWRLIFLRRVVFGQMFYHPTHGNLLQQLTDEGNVWDRPVVAHCISFQVIFLK